MPLSFSHNAAMRPSSLPDQSGQNQSGQNQSGQNQSGQNQSGQNQSWQILAYRLAIQQLQSSQQQLTEQNQQLEQTVTAQTATLKQVIRELRQELLSCSRAETQLQVTQTQLNQQIEDRRADLEQTVARLQAEVAQHHLTEQALRLSERRFQKLADNIPGMIYQFRLSADGQVSFPFVSSACQDILGYSPEQVYQHPCLLVERVHPDDRQGFDAAVTRSAQQLTQWDWVGRMLTRSEDIRWIRAKSKPERQSDGAILWDGLLIDISDQKRAELALSQSKRTLAIQVEHRTADLQKTIQQLNQEVCDRTQAETALRQSELQLKRQTQDLETTVATLKQTQAQLVQSEKMSALGQLVAGVAHEINNPVSFIYGNLSPAQDYIQDLLTLLDLYQQYVPHPPAELAAVLADVDLDFVKSDIVNVLNSMAVGADRIKQIVLSLRTFSRMDESDWKTVDLHEGLDSTLLILGHRLKAQPHRPQIEVVKDYGNLPQVDCYAGQLNQVFMNLLSNAIDALEDCHQTQPTAAPLSITIRTRATAEVVEIAVTDTGIGMPAEVCDLIFDPFFTTKPIGKGTGMGLSISYQIVTDKHGGSLTCTSQSGQGTTFYIQLPLRQ